VADDVEAADPLLAEDTRVGDFRIRGLLGEGAMGQVYLAQDTTLGRRVALKLIKRSVMESHGIERFLEEARATASLNHPHIVTLHAVGEHDGRPYLALEYIDGESLRARLRGGPLPMREALRYCRAVAEAIAEAHRRGLVHADLKPENIVIPQDGRVRVVDFGLSRLVGDAPNRASGTPAYMAPERWRGHAPTGAIDVWALGVTLHELITGSRPIPDTMLARLAFAAQPLDLPALPSAPWASLTRDCLATDPAARPSADDLVRRLTALLDPRASIEDTERCPFPGLAAFTRDDAPDYFGRRAELDGLVEQLRTRALVPIVGPSGIGKSSFVRAALIPRLDETGAWVVVALRPGSTPFQSIAAALARKGRSIEEVATSLRDHPDSLSLILTDLATHHDARVLLFVDQFEETFTLASSDAEAIAFCDCLARAAVAGEPWRIVLTLRDDFLGRLAASRFTRPHLGAVVPLAPMSAVDLRAAVLGPLANVGFEVDDPHLVSKLVADVEGQPACLPLLQFTCHALWERRDPVTRQVLTSEYETMGGATGALGAHAQRFMAELTGDQIRLARSILLALVTPDGTRRPRLQSELLEELPAGAADVISRLLERRLIVATRDAEQDVTRIEVAHEALATTWPQLGRWLDETYEQRLLVSELGQAAVVWQRRGRRDDETWGGVALVEAVRKVAAWNISLPSSSRSFLEACQTRDRRLRRRRRWLVSAATGFLAAVAITAIIAAVAFSRKEQEAVANHEALLANQKAIELAAADMGELDLELEPFDWDPVSQQAISPAVLPTLAWKLRTVGAKDRNDPGPGYREPNDLRRGTPRWRSNVLVEHVEARSGPAFLEVASRGGRCAPTILFLQRLPSYSERNTGQVMRVRVPTCKASRVDMVEIAEGDFIRNDQHADDTNEDVRAYLPRFAIDRTEVTRAAFATFGGMEPLTGEGAAPTSAYVDANQDHDRLPVVGVSYYTAANYCRYLGKTLPTVEQWQKAFRGGLTIDGKPNPIPTRLTPSAGRPGSANVQGVISPVASFPADTSPYGVVDLAGNVSEWTLTPAVANDERGLRTVLGANWDTPAKLGHDKITWRNARPDRYLDFTLGIRCVSNDIP